MAGNSRPWPETLLPSKVTNARILTFGYDAYVAQLRGVVSQTTIGNHGMNLLNALATFRSFDKTVGASRALAEECLLPLTYVCRTRALSYSLHTA
jgi:hypothetical protein